MHILRHGVVDIQKCYRILADSCSDKLTESSINIYFARYRNTTLSQTAVNEARYKAKLCLERRPALTGDAYILAIASMLLNPVKKRQLILSQLLKNLRLLITCPKFCLHISNHLRDSCITCVLVKCLKQVKL